MRRNYYTSMPKSSGCDDDCCMAVAWIHVSQSASRARASGHHTRVQLQEQGLDDGSGRCANTPSIFFSRINSSKSPLVVMRVHSLLGPSPVVGHWHVVVRRLINVSASAEVVGAMVAGALACPLYGGVCLCLHLHLACTMFGKHKLRPATLLQS